MPSDDIAYLLKFAPKEALIDDLINGQLHMNAAGYYHDLPGEQGDPLEASLTYGMGIYANWLFPIYCMFTVRKSDIDDNAVVISKRMIEEFRCAGGWIGIVRYDRFDRLLNRKIDSGNDISLHAPVFYGAPAPRLTGEALKASRTISLSKRPSTHISENTESSGRSRSNAAFYQMRNTLAAKMKSTTMQSWTWTAASRTIPERSRCRVSKKRKTASC